MSEEKTITTPSVSDDQPAKETTDFELRDVFSKFLQASDQNRISFQSQLSALQSAVDRLSENSSPESTSEHADTHPDRRQPNRRTSIFFGAPSASKSHVVQRPIRKRLSSASPESPLSNRPLISTAPSVIQVLQAEIVYENQLKVSSLEGLTYLSKQLQLLLSRYPGREIKTAHMVAVPLRQHVVASWNSHLNKQAIATGTEEPEIMVNDWLSFDNDLVQEMLLEAARPRTREQYSQELVRFLLKAIPQSPDINAENFSKIFFDPLMKSLHDLLHLYDLLSVDTSNFSNNASKMPSTSYGTRENPGHIQLWIISLGSQKDAILQWLGKDELTKHKTLAPAVKYIRSKLMSGRSQSEDRQDFQHQLTPIKYEDIRKTQGESHQRQQMFAPRHQHPTPSTYRPYSSNPRSSMAAIDIRDDYPGSYDDYPSQPYDSHDTEYKDYGDDYEIPSLHKKYSEENTDIDDPCDNTDNVTSYCAINTTQSYRTAISAAFRGYCSELFVYGKCSRRDSGCTMDHSSAAQELCIKSFFLLSKRELSQHADLPPWRLPSTPIPQKLNASAPYSNARSLRPQPPAFNQPRTYGNDTSGGSIHRFASGPPRPNLK